MEQDRATVGQVAELAGVSVASVSRVLNGLPSSASMAERVQAAAAELGYRPNASARSLKVDGSHQLAFAVADVGNPVYVEMMRAIEDETRARGYRLLVSSIRRPHGRHARAARQPRPRVRRRPRPQPAARRRRARVRAPRAHPAGRRHRHRATRRRRSTTCGPTRPAASAWRSSTCTSRAPPDRVRQRAQRHRARLGPAARLRAHLAHLGLDPLRSAARRGRRLHARRRPRRPPRPLLDRTAPDAVLGGNDLLAIATMQALAERGLRVPDDVAVVGMDDTELAGVTTPSLTSVDLGGHAARPDRRPAAAGPARPTPTARRSG